MKKEKTETPAKVKSIKIPGDCNTIILCTDKDDKKKVADWYQRIRKESLIK